MTEAEWLASDDPGAMLKHLRFDEYEEPTYGGMVTESRHPSLASDRQLRLFACAAARTAGVAPLRPDVEDVIRIAEDVADDQRPGWCQELLGASRGIDADQGWVWCATCLDVAVGIKSTLAHTYSPCNATLAGLLRDVVGNPHGRLPPSFDYQEACGRCLGAGVTPDMSMCPSCGGHGFRVSWRTTEVSEVADWIYGSYAFGDLPVLADALERSGCRERPLIDHLRGREGVILVDGSEVKSVVSVPLRCPHVRGCWALDRVLGMEVSR